MRIKLSHIMNFCLSAFALGLFAFNLRAELAGQHFNLRTGDGATILTVFLIAGVVVQLTKLAQGHEGAFELTITLILLAAHVVGDMFIWYRTQINHLPLPAEIPFLIIGGYWLIGVIDFSSMYLPSQLKLYGKGYISPQQRIAELESDLKLAQQAHVFAQQNAAIAQQLHSANPPIAPQLQFVGLCQHCEREFKKSSERALQNAINAHMKSCPVKLLASKNGHSSIEHIAE